MLYEDYYSIYLELKDKRNQRRKIDNQIEELRSIVDVQAVAPKDVTGGTNLKQDKMLNYVAKKEQLEEKKISIDETIEIIKKCLKSKEYELKTSHEILDIVYYYRYIQHLKVRHFYRLVPTSLRQCYRYLKEINKNLFGEEE